MSDVYNFETFIGTKSAYEIFVIAKALFVKVVSLVELLDADGIYFISDELEDLFDLGTRMLGSELDDEKKGYVIQYLENELELKELLTLLTKAKGSH